MKILFLSDKFPWPLHSGGTKRTYALLRALSSKHDIILSSQSMKNIDEHLSHFKRLIKYYIPAPMNSSGRYVMPHFASIMDRLKFLGADLMRHRVPYRFRFVNDEWAKCLQAVIHEVDAIFCRYMYMTSLIDHSCWHKVIVDADDLNYRQCFQEMKNSGNIKRALYYCAGGIRYYFYEQGILDKAAQVIMTSKSDVHRIRTRNKVVIPNGVFLPDHEEIMSISPQFGNIAMIAHFGYGPNIQGLRWFIENVWPRLIQKCSVTANIVGLKASRETLPFASLPGIEIIGPVQDTYPWFRKSILTIVPLWRGTGTRIKILESLACGTPVVSTILGAEGLDDLGPYQGVFRSDAPEEMAIVIKELLSDPVHANKLGCQGQQYVKDHYTWDRTTAILSDAVTKWVH